MSRRPLSVAERRFVARLLAARCRALGEDLIVADQVGEPGQPDTLTLQKVAVEVHCEAFTLNLITARLESEAVKVRRSALDGLTRAAGPGSVWGGKQLAFRRSDSAAVEALSVRVR